ncbi:ring-cleaving dioxygenase [Rubrivirga sp.]|uniref:ring-cleaving dioxygenase n=1 Tax=Rubrivirga sp. TaxID=1885344 RepID=UPI003C78859F
MLTGLHHVTAICGPAQPNVDVYAGTLGLRLVKQTVNFDDPGTYHLYYADGPARPGSFLTFFPWPSDGLRGRVGAGQATATAYTVSPGALSEWIDRFAEAGIPTAVPTSRFGQNVLTVHDGDGLVIDLIEDEDASGQWADGLVPTSMALGAFHSVTLCSHNPDATLRVLTEAYGYQEHGQEGDRLRLVNPNADRARFVDIDVAPQPAGRMGIGTVHHVAFRAPDDDAELEARETLLSMGLQPTPQIDRQYFHSVYTREPGGILFEIATDPPGFTVDEPFETLGRALKLPAQYEPQRAAIEARLTPLELPY